MNKPSVAGDRQIPRDLPRKHANKIRPFTGNYSECQMVMQALVRQRVDIPGPVSTAGTLVNNAWYRRA